MKYYINAKPPNEMYGYMPRGNVIALTINKTPYRLRKSRFTKSELKSYRLYRKRLFCRQNRHLKK